MPIKVSRRSVQRDRLAMFLEETPEQMSAPAYRPFKGGPFQMTMGKIEPKGESEE